MTEDDVGVKLGTVTVQLSAEMASDLNETRGTKLPHYDGILMGANVVIYKIADGPWQFLGPDALKALDAASWVPLQPETNS